MFSPIFIDVEASGITSGCYPIEVGWAQAELAGGIVRLHAQSILIRPTDAWRSESWRWDPASVAAHGITMDGLLRDGIGIGAASGILDGAFAGKVLATDTGAGDWDDGWLQMLYEAAGRDRPWAISATRSGGHVAARLRLRSLDPRTVRPALRDCAPSHSHAAAEDAMVFAWEWGMAELIGSTGAAGLDAEALAAALADLPGLVPRALWPALTAESRSRMRHRGPD